MCVGSDAGPTNEIESNNKHVIQDKQTMVQRAVAVQCQLIIYESMSGERDWISSCSLISHTKYLKADCERRNSIKIIREAMSLNIYYISISH